MSTIDDKLNEVLNIAGEVVPEENKKETKELTVPEDSDPEIDFETGRKNLYNLLDKGMKQLMVYSILQKRENILVPMRLQDN